MSAKREKVLEMVSGWSALELWLKCLFVGIWQILQISLKRLWKGHKRKVNKSSPVELTVDSSIGTHCYIKIMGVKYHYVEIGPKSGQIVLILGDAPDTGELWSSDWSTVVQQLADTGYHVVTLDLRGTGGSESGGRGQLSPPRAVEELSALLKALGVSEDKQAVIIGFGVGGMLTWYLVHCHGEMVSKFAVVEAPHPNLYWQYPPAAFCEGALHFIQWPYFPERWLAEGELQGGEGKWASSRACDWTGALNYVRGAAWWRVSESARVLPGALLLGTSAAQLVRSARHCARPAPRLVPRASPAERQLQRLILDFLIDKAKVSEDVPRTLVSRIVGAVADRSRGLTSRLAHPTHA